MSHPAHHFSLHKLRLTKKKRTKILDSMVYVVGIAGNLAVLPQVVKAWDGPSPGLAVSTWILFTGVSFIWLLYAMAHRQKPLIAAQVGGLAVNLAVVSGWLFHNI